MLIAKLEVHGHELTLWMLSMHCEHCRLLHVPAIEILWFSFIEKGSVCMLYKTYELIAKRKQMDSVEHFSIA